jgi:hypothetical protein
MIQAQQSTGASGLVSALEKRDEARTAAGDAYDDLVVLINEELSIPRIV